MMHESARKLGLRLLGSFLVAGTALASQPAAQIDLDPAIECWSDSEFPILGALVTPPQGIVRSRLYFRCSLYPYYYFIDLAAETGAYRGTAPQAEEACPQVHYYVEALGSDFSSVRTEERIADVAGPEECRRRYPAAAWFPGENPNIFLGSLGAAGMAPGFKTLGIVGFISSAGSVAVASGGISTGALAGIAAAGGAAAGLGVLATGGNSTTTTAPIVGPSPSSSSTTTIAATSTAPSPTGIEACFTLDPANGQVEVNSTVRIDGRCSRGDHLSYHYELGDGRTKDGQAFVTTFWPNPGTYTITLTVMGREGNQDSVNKTVNIFNRDDLRTRTSLVESSLASEILEGEGIEGQIVLAGRGFSVSANAPARIQFDARRGAVSVEAIATAGRGPFLWRFDFSGAKGFVPGSLRTISGQEVTRDAFSVVLRFTGSALERARFEYRLEP
jgi:PKD repeat protein